MIIFFPVTERREQFPKRNRAISDVNTPRPVESGVKDRVAGYVIEPRIEILYSPLHLAPSRWMGQRYVQQLMQDDEALLGVVVLLVTWPGLDVNAVCAGDQFRVI